VEPLEEAHVRLRQGSLYTCQQRIGSWAINLDERLLLALEADHIHGKHLVQRLQIKPGSAEVVTEGGTTTSRTLMACEERTLRSCCSNAILVSVCFLLDHTNSWLCSMVSTAGDAVLKWHTLQNRELRACDAIEAWVKNQTFGGGYLQHVVAIADSLTSRSALTKALLRTSPLEADDEVINGEIATEDSFADLYGQFVCVLMSQRLRRGTWFLHGWPWRAFRCLAGGDTYRATVAELENDIAIFESLQAKRGQIRVNGDDVEQACPAEDLVQTVGSRREGQSCPLLRGRVLGVVAEAMPCIVPDADRGGLERHAEEQQDGCMRS